MEKEGLFAQHDSGEVCPDCGEEIRLVSASGIGEIELDCSCGSALALT